MNRHGWLRSSDPKSYFRVRITVQSGNKRRHQIGDAVMRFHDRCRPQHLYDDRAEADHGVSLRPPGASGWVAMTSGRQVAH